jgi:hypothetical protein
MKGERITLKEVRDSGMKKWEWLMKHPELGAGTHVVREIPFFDSELRQYNEDGCSACSYNKDLGGSNCGECPIIGIAGQCNLSKGNLFNEWCAAKTDIQRAFYAEKIYEAHVAIEVEEVPEIQVGDTVDMNIVGGWSRGPAIVIGIYKGKAYCQFKSGHISIARMIELTFISRPEKPVEHVFEGVEWDRRERYAVPFGTKGRYYQDKDSKHGFHCFAGNRKKYDVIVRECKEDTE